MDEFRGIYENGVIHPSEPVSVPDGTEVAFHVVDNGNLAEIQRQTREFRANRSIDELLEESGVQPLKSIKELAGFWPPEDDIDEFLAYIRQLRNA